MHFRHRFLRPHGALIDPIADQVDLRFVERIGFVRHEIIVGRRQRDAPVQIALVGFARLNDLAIFAAFEGGLFGVQAELAFLFVRPVAFDAVLAKDGLNVLGEIDFLFILCVGKGDAREAGQYHGKFFHRIFSGCDLLRTEPNQSFSFTQERKRGSGESGI